MTVETDAICRDEAGYAKIHRLSDPMKRWHAMRALCKTDLYYLLSVVCSRKDLRHTWFYARAREVEHERDGMLDLWFRGAGKSSLITFGMTLQDILRDPETTCLIMSFNKQRAQAFLSQIKREMEQNELINWLFPDILWGVTRPGGRVDLEPYKRVPVWSTEKLIVRREGRPKEATIEAGGLVDGQAVGVHPDLVVFDDVVTRDSVRTPESIRIATQAYKESLALGAGKARRRMIGTRWHLRDTYSQVIEDGAFTPRIYPAYGPDGKSVLLSENSLNELYKQMGPLVFASQMLLNPKAESEMGFEESTLRYYDDHHGGVGMNCYILVDPANAPNRDSSYTAMCVVGLGPDENFYWLDGLRDRLNLEQRIRALLSLHRQWSATSRVMGVGYETFGAGRVDVEAIGSAQRAQNYNFHITELKGRGKGERIPLLEPQYVEGRWFWPHQLRRVQVDGQTVDLVQEVKDQEFLAWPFGRHPDFLDAMSRINDPALNVVWPKPRPKPPRDAYESGPRRRGSWMSA